MKFTKLAGIAAVAVSLAFAGSAMAAPITGTLTLNGTSGPQQFVGSGGATIATYTGISFAPSSNVFNASAGTGDLAIFTGTSGTIEDFTYVPTFSAIPSFVIISGTDTLTFNLDTVSAAATNGWTGTDSLGFINLTLTGVLTVNGGEETDAVILFSGTKINSTASSWSATLIAEGRPTQVPEPLTLALLGAGLAGMGALRFRRKA